MTHPFEISEQIDLDATPEQVWAAIATGPGVDSWFFGRTTIEPRLGGRCTFEMGGEVQRSTVTAWEPGRRFAYRTDDAPDGTFMAFESIIEAREGGSSTLRFVHNGLLAGDDWATEYDALRDGDPMYLRKLAAYLAHFAGRTVRQSVFLVGPQVTDADRVWSVFGDLVGGPITEGRPVGFTLGTRRIEGTVEFARDRRWFGVVTADGIHTFMHAFHSTVVCEYDGFATAGDEKTIESDTQSWLATAFE